MLTFTLFCSFANNLDLCGPVTGRPCPGSPPFSPPPPFVSPPPVSVPGDYQYIIVQLYLLCKREAILALILNAPVSVGILISAACKYFRW